MNVSLEEHLERLSQDEVRFGGKGLSLPELSCATRLLSCIRAVLANGDMPKKKFKAAVLQQVVWSKYENDFLINSGVENPAEQLLEKWLPKFRKLNYVDRIFGSFILSVRKDPIGSHKEECEKLLKALETEKKSKKSKEFTAEDLLVLMYCSAGGFFPALLGWILITGDLGISICATIFCVVITGLLIYWLTDWFDEPAGSTVYQAIPASANLDNSWLDDEDFDDDLDVDDDDILGLFKSDNDTTFNVEDYRSMADDRRHKAQGSSNWTDYDDWSCDDHDDDGMRGFDSYEENHF